MITEEFLINYLKENNFKFRKEDFYIAVSVYSEYLDKINDDFIPNLKSWEVEWELDSERSIIKIWI